VRITNRRANSIDALESRLTGPKRIALFGHRNVGKTTLLAMLYRQA
jgi:ATPase subunit of ABC transporter with duplicated ATPase domains